MAGSHTYLSSVSQKALNPTSRRTVVQMCFLRNPEIHNRHMRTDSALPELEVCNHIYSARKLGQFLEETEFPQN